MAAKPIVDDPLAPGMPPRRDLVHVIPEFIFESGARLRALQIAYSTYGTLNAARDNAILLSTNASGLRQWATPFIRDGGAFDPSRFFIISVDAIGGGGSSKPSDGLGLDFPRYTIRDLVNAQHHLITQRLELATLQAVAGPSMASLVGIEWAARFPQFVRALALWTPGVRCDAMGRAMIDALCAVITFDPVYESGRYRSQPVEGFRRAGTVFFPHLLSRQFLDAIPTSEQARLQRMVGETWAANWDANDLIYRYGAVAGCDLPAQYGGLEALAKAVRCPTLLVPCSSDQLFTMAALQPFAERLPDVTWAPLQSDKGHFAAALPAGTPEFDFFDRTTARFFDQLRR